MPLIYTILIQVSHTYMHFEWNMFALKWNHGGISCDVHFAGHLRSNRTNIWSDKSNIRNVRGGARTGIENRWFIHIMSSPGRAYQVVHKSQMLALVVVGVFFIMRAFASCLPPPLFAPTTKHVCEKLKASVHYNQLWSITEPIPIVCTKMYSCHPIYSCISFFSHEVRRRFSAT